MSLKVTGQNPSIGIILLVKEGRICYSGEQVFQQSANTPKNIVSYYQHLRHVVVDREAIVFKDLSTLLVEADNEWDIGEIEKKRKRSSSVSLILTQPQRHM